MPEDRYYVRVEGTHWYRRTPHTDVFILKSPTREGIQQALDYFEKQDTSHYTYGPILDSREITIGSCMVDVSFEIYSGGSGSYQLKSPSVEEMKRTMEIMELNPNIKYTFGPIRDQE